jgi:hypothetical protein
VMELTCRSDFVSQDRVAGAHILIESLFCLNPLPRLGATEPCRNMSQNRK